jgi:hypothetical protein
VIRSSPFGEGPGEWKSYSRFVKWSKRWIGKKGFAVRFRGWPDLDFRSWIWVADRDPPAGGEIELRFWDGFKRYLR